MTRHQIKESEALASLERNEFRCALTDLQRGRCAGATPSAPGDATVPLHHITYRSHGGDHSSENLLPLCPKHHGQIHGDRLPKLNGPYGDPGLGRYYSYDAGDNEHIEIQKLYFWEDIKADLASEEQERHNKLMGAAYQVNVGRLEAAIQMAEIDAKGLYQLRNDYTSAVEYMMGELGEPESSARNALRVGHFLRVNPHLLDKVIQHQLHFTTIRAALPALQKIPGERVEAVVDEMIDAQKSDVPGDSIVESVRDAAGLQSIPEWEVTAEVSMPLSARVTLRFHRSTPQGAAKAFDAATGASGPLSDLLVVGDKAIEQV